MNTKLKEKIREIEHNYAAMHASEAQLAEAYQETVVELARLRKENERLRKRCAKLRRDLRSASSL